MLFELFISLLVISLISLIGVITLGLNHKKVEAVLEYLVAFSVGALLGDVFVHLLPELAESGFTLEISLAALSGIVVFFILERIIHWHHHHEGHEHHTTCDTSPLTILLGDALHNFLDGIILAGAFLISPVAGISTAIAIIFHEIPQEIGDYGVLIYCGLSRKKAMFYNFLSALTAFLGAGVALALQSLIFGITPLLTAFTVGSFLYIAGTDLLPELHKDKKMKKSLYYTICLILGIAIMVALLALE